MDSDTLHNYKYTMISYDYGESFTRLAAPKEDHLGNTYQCNDKCYLNIHMSSSSSAFS